MQRNSAYHFVNLVQRKTFIILFIVLLNGCSKLVEVDAPPTALTSDNIYTDDATAASVLTSIYTLLSGNPLVGGQTIPSISLISGLSADELSLYGGAANSSQTLVQFYQNSLNEGQSTNESGDGKWNAFYSNIYIVNLALERLAGSGSLTPSVRQQLTGESKFLRAFFYFYLVNLYGDVPLATSSDYRTNSVLAKTPKDLVYHQIIADLKDAQNLLVDGYVAGDAKTNTSERVRPNKWAATALLARAYLYASKYDSAEMQATAIINNKTLYDTVSLNNAFLKNSREAIWQLQPVNIGWNTEDARLFIIPSTGPTNNSNAFGNPVYLSPQLLSSFESGDNRRTNWVDSVTAKGVTYFFPYKYKSATLNAAVTEYSMVLRTGEQYLIRAEARAQQNNISGAHSDLNIIRTRAGLPNTSVNGQNSLLNTILHERQVELFSEWGHRWLDLKRTGNIDNVMNDVSPTKGSIWSTNWQLYPIPSYEILQDPNIIQNNGY